MRVRLVIAGVRGMYAEARDLVGRGDAVRIVVVAALCVVLAGVRTAGRPRTRNALRHFAWSAWLAAEHGPDVALELTAEHEEHSVDPLDSEVDVRNNAAGRRYGQLHAGEVVGVPVPLAVWRLLGVGRRKWAAGRLWAVRRGRIERSRRRGRRGRPPVRSVG